jgi:hypothetical protein
VHIRFRRSGGFAGLQAPPLEIDSQQLPADKARELEQLVEQARVLDQPARPDSSPTAPPAPSAPPAPDAFQYDVHVQDGVRSCTLRVHEGSMAPEVARLVQWLAQEARGALGRK